MAPELAAATRAQQAKLTQDFLRWGAVQTVKLDRVDPIGADLYTVLFKNGEVHAYVAPLQSDGKAPGLMFREFP